MRGSTEMIKCEDGRYILEMNTHYIMEIKRTFRHFKSYLKNFFFYSDTWRPILIYLFYLRQVL